jgi:monolysocardiolipin acyltransferase
MSLLPVHHGLTLMVVGSLCKLFLATRYASFRLHPTPAAHQLLDWIEHPLKREGRPLITYSNHISTIDDPLMWSFLPMSILFTPQKVRWALGADELLFQSNAESHPSILHRLFWKLSSKFFHSGKVLPVVRGNGLQQPSILLAQQILTQGDWLHIFVEGKVNPYSPDILLPLRWGISHLVLNHHQQHQQCPILVPLVIRGNCPCSADHRDMGSY